MWVDFKEQIVLGPPIHSTTFSPRNTPLKSPCPEPYSWAGGGGPGCPPHLHVVPSERHQPGGLLRRHGFKIGACVNTGPP